VIPRANINAWRKIAPWPDSSQIEQDLVISRALIEMYNRPEIARGLIFRGGTALHKIYLHPPGRYSEDIDLVQRDAGPIGALVSVIRDALDHWLGTPSTKRGEGRFTLKYRFETSFEPVIDARLKVEINTREHFSVHGFTKQKFAVENPWFSGSAKLTTYEISELLGTKLRALYQRKKGRDLFDLWLGLGHPDTSIDDLLGSFAAYMEFGKTPVSRAQFEKNMDAKMQDDSFLSDMEPLLRSEIKYDHQEAWKMVYGQIISRLPGDPWKGAADLKATLS
jgi:predicted nucleotidyltransferase component of viral defense system